jgi:hypothetical protein
MAETTPGPLIMVVQFVRFVGAWNHPGTTQGLYMMGPNAEYLEGRFAAGSEPSDIRRRLNSALERWKSLASEKGYANKPVPSVPLAIPPGISGELILRVNVRDLPRGGQDKSGARFTDVQRNDGYFLDYTRWAWNETWIGIDKASDFVPSGSGEEPVGEAAARKIATLALVDTVRGQAPNWNPEHIALLTLKKKALKSEGGIVTIELTGSARMEAGSQGYDARLYGQARFDRASGKFSAFDLVASGMRKGAWRFNRREQDPGPAPMGVALSLRRL